MNPWSLAVRHVARNRRRGLLTGAIVAFGFAALTLASGFMAQSFKGLRDSTIRSGLGHLQFADQRLFDASSPESSRYAIANAPRLIAIFKRDPAVRAVMPRAEFFGLASTGGSSVPFLGLGVDAEAEKIGSDIPGTVARGRWLKDAEHGAVLGTGLARALGTQVGDTLTLMATTPAGALNALDVEVVGIARIAVRALDDRYLATTVTAAEALLDTPDAVTRVSVLLDRTSRERETGAQLLDAAKKEFPQLAVRRWDQLAEFYAQVRVLYLGIFGFLGTVLIVVVFLATFNAMLMAIAERTREIGTLRAIGMRARDVRRQFLREGIVTGVAGSIAGAALTLAIMAILNASGIELPPPPGGTRGFPLHIEFFPLAYLGAGIAMTAALALAAWLPARRAARMPIVEALAHV
jgi:putative ABC transport system permease protein